MKIFKKATQFAVLTATLAAPAAGRAQDIDFGKFVEQQLKARSVQQFGVEIPLAQSSTGPYTALDNLGAVELAAGLSASQITAGTHQDNDMIALWPNDKTPPTSLSQ